MPPFMIKKVQIHYVIRLKSPPATVCKWEHYVLRGRCYKAIIKYHRCSPMIVCLIDDQIILYHSDVQHIFLSFFMWGGHLVKRLFLDLRKMGYTLIEDQNIWRAKRSIAVFIFHSNRLPWSDIKFTGYFKRCNFRLFQYLLF